MNRLLRFVVVLVAALLLVPLLPLYVERTLVSSWQVGRAGDIIEWGWKVCTLRSFLSDYPYLAAEQDPQLWLALNLALAFAYGVALTLLVDRILAYWQRRDGRAR